MSVPDRGRGRNDKPRSCQLRRHQKANGHRGLTKAEVEFGDMKISALEDWRVREDFLNWRDQVADSSGLREADYRLSAISAMLTWAVRRARLSQTDGEFRR